MPSVGSGNGVATIRIHRESLEGVNSLEQIPNIKSLYVKHSNGFYEYNVRKIVIDPVDSDAFYITVKQEHNTPPTGSASSPVVFTPYIAGKFKNGNYDALLGNAVQGEESTKYMIVDKNNQLVPSNLTAINNRSAGKAQVVESNYEVSSYKNIRYDGSTHTAADFNLRSDTTKYKPVENVQTYVTYFDYLKASDPEFGTFKKNVTTAKLKYLMEIGGDVRGIVDDVDGVNLSLVRQNYLEGATATIALGGIFDSTFNNLNNSHTIFKSGKRLIPIAYSQVSEYDANGNITGYTKASDITFFSSDIQNSNVSSDMSFSARAIGTQVIGNNTVPFTVEFFDITNGPDASYDTNDDYILLEPADTNEPFAINIDTYVKVDRNTTYRFNVTYEIQKSTNGGSSWSILDSTTVNHDDTREYSASIQDSITDTSGTDTFAYRLRVSTIDKHSLANNLEINTASFIKLTQSPKSAANNTVTGDYWIVDANDRSIISGSTALSKFYGATQNDIENSGFDTLNYPLIPQIGDEIRFEATETRAFRIEEILQEQPKIILRLDREVPSGVDEDLFLLRRYIDDPAYVMLDITKKVGTTTGGVLKPEYLPSGSESRVEATLQELREKNQI